MTLITKATAEAARLFFLKHSSYCKFSLPIYFDFEPLLSSIQTALRTKQNGINDIGYKKLVIMKMLTIHCKQIRMVSIHGDPLN